MNKFPPEVSKELKWYVYMYVDPRNNRPFYVGKGVRNRAFTHLAYNNESEKVKRILEIRTAGKEPKIEILRHGLTDNQAALVEATIIDCIGLDHLTNLVGGHHSRSFGRVKVEEVLDSYTAPKVDIKIPCILITINRLYRSDMSAKELHETTRGIWKIGRRREKATHAMAVYQGVIREVYRIDHWLPAGTLHYATRDSDGFKSSGRWEFKGYVDHKFHRQYLRTSVRHLLGSSSQNPIRYVHC